ncbi:MAG: Tfp pilus assembly protein FimT/FimU [Phycisphaeraceae bacterium JB051]
MEKNRKHKGFTLFELIAVILLLAVFAAAVRGPVVDMMDRINTRNSIEQIKTIDRLLRLEAKRSGNAIQLHIDPLEGIMMRTDSSEEQTLVGQAVQLDASCQIERIHLAPQTDDFDELNAVITCSPDGATPSYAMEIQTANQRTWLLFAGLTGQCYQFASEDELATVLDEISRPWSELD